MLEQNDNANDTQMQAIGEVPILSMDARSYKQLIKNPLKNQR